MINLCALKIMAKDFVQGVLVFIAALASFLVVDTLIGYLAIKVGIFPRDNLFPLVGDSFMNGLLALVMVWILSLFGYALGAWWLLPWYKDAVKQCTPKARIKK